MILKLLGPTLWNPCSKQQVHTRSQWKTVPCLNLLQVLIEAAATSRWGIRGGKLASQELKIPTFWPPSKVCCYH